MKRILIGSLFLLFSSFAAQATVVNVTSYVTPGTTGTAANPWTSADGTAGIQAALAVLEATGTAPHDGVLYAPAGYYKITTRIDFTAKATNQVGQYVGDQALTFMGDGPLETILIGSTGGMVIDTTGRGHLKLEDFGIIQANSQEYPQSTLGIFQARGQVSGGSGYMNFPQHQTIRRVYIDLASQPTANGNHGSLGIYNRGAESGVYDNLQINADIPLTLTADNIYSISTTVTGLTHPSIAECTNNHIRGGNYTSMATSANSSWTNIVYATSIALQGSTDNTTIDGAILRKAADEATVAPLYAMRVYPDYGTLTAQTLGLRIHTIAVENYAGVLGNSAPLVGAEISATIQQNSSVPLILLGNSVAELRGSRIDITPSSSGNTQVVYDGMSTTAGMTNCTVLLPPTLRVQLPNSPNVGNRYFTETGTTLDAVNLPAKELTLATGANQNVALGVSSFARITGPGGAFSVGGFSGGVDGRVLYVWNFSGQQMTIKNIDTGSASGNRIYTNTNADVVLGPAESAVTFIYHAAAGVWVLMSSQG
jgi:hypothetical protein